MKTLLISGFILSLASVASAAEIKGTLFDKMCSTQGVAGAKDHTRECALMPPCQASGYGVLTADGKFLAFDAAGNTKAIAALKGSKQKDDLKVTVTGDVKGETVTVTSIKLM